MAARLILSQLARVRFSYAVRCYDAVALTVGAATLSKWIRRGFESRQRYVRRKMPYKDPKRQSEYQMKWGRRRREEWFAANGPCVDCGTWDNLQIDHIDPATKVSHNIWSWSAERRAAELAKCAVRCHPCHVVKTWATITPEKVERRRRATVAYNKSRVLSDATRAKMSESAKKRHARERNAR